MSYGANSVTISGNLTRDPEVRQAGDTSVVKFGIAHNERVRQNGEWTDRASYFDVTFFGAFGESVAKQVGKGSPVVVVGQLRQRTWEQDGAKRSAVEIIGRDIVTGERKGHPENPGGGGSSAPPVIGGTRHGVDNGYGTQDTDPDPIPF